MVMNFTPAPTLIFTLFSLFRRRTPQPTFTHAAPPITTQVLITREVTTHVDPPVVVKTASVSEEEQKNRPLPLPLTIDISEKQQAQLYPETPRAPTAHRLTFFVPQEHDWNKIKVIGRGGDNQSYYDVDEISLSEADPEIPPGLESVSRPAVPEPDTMSEPKTLAKPLFFFGFVFPGFWVAGVVVMVMPLQTTTDWEAGRNSMEIKWGRAVIRETELRWARRCMVALMTEVFIVLLVVVVVKWGVLA